MLSFSIAKFFDVINRFEISSVFCISTHFSIAFAIDSFIDFSRKVSSNIILSYL